MTATDHETRRAAEEAIAADPQPGHIYRTSWGYDQTNVEYFQIVRRTRGTVTLRRIAADYDDKTRRVYPVPGAWARDWGIDGNPGTPSRLKAEKAGYSEKVCHLRRPTKYNPNPTPGAGFRITESRTAWPYVGGGAWDTLAAGMPGH